MRLKKSAPECPFECGGGGEMLFGQCPHGGVNKLKGASLRMKRKSLVFTVLDFDHYSSCSSIIIYRRQKVSSMPTCFTAFIYHVKLCNVLVFRVRFSKQRIFQWTSKEEEELVWAALSGDRGHLYHFRPRNFQSILSWFYLGAFCALFYMRWGWVAVIVIIISELLGRRWCLPHFIIKSSSNSTLRHTMSEESEICKT